MVKIVHRWFWIWDFDREEKWLNEMAAGGLALVDVGFCRYTFEETLPGEYTVRLEMLENLPVHAQSVQYLKFLEETGAEYLGSVLRWVYLRKKKSNGEFDLYSDYGSRIRHLNRILALLGVLLPVNLLNGVNSIRVYLDGRLSPAPLVIGLLCLALVLLLGFGFLHILRKRRRLQREHQLFE